MSGLTSDVKGRDLVRSDVLLPLPSSVPMPLLLLTMRAITRHTLGVRGMLCFSFVRIDQAMFCLTFCAVRHLPA
jgi:hypothetical protein